jgi:uncharacterized protein YkwD
MKKQILLILAVLFLQLHFGFAQNKTDIMKAFLYLNNVRQNPGAFSDEIKINLKNIKPQKELVWNDTLALVAQSKAEDMAKRNYFNHVDPEGKGINYLILKAGYSIPKDWAEPISKNYFESLSAGRSNPVESIQSLLNDNGEKAHEKAGHRSHLLGIKDFYSNLCDVGIGFAVNEKSLYKSYFVIIIAKHNF